jgi:hypothetical protein
MKERKESVGAAAVAFMNYFKQLEVNVKIKVLKAANKVPWESYNKFLRIVSTIWTRWALILQSIGPK